MSAVYRCPRCGEEMLCTPQLGALEAEVERLTKRLAEADALIEQGSAALAQSTRLLFPERLPSLAEANARIDKAITWLVTVKADQPASIIAGRAKLALDALRPDYRGEGDPDNATHGD